MGTSVDTGTPFTGDVQLNYNSSTSYGKMQLAAASPFGDSAGQLRLYGSLDMNGYSQKFAGMLSDGTKGVLSNSSTTASTLTLDSTDSLTYYGVINGSATNPINLVKFGTGTQNLNDTVTVTNLTVNNGVLTTNAALTVLGDSSISGGTINVQGSLNVGNGATLTVNSGTVNLSGAGVTGSVTIETDGVMALIAESSDYDTSIGTSTFSNNGLLNITLIDDNTFSKFTAATVPGYDENTGFISLLYDFQPTAGLSYTLATTVGDLSATTNLDSWLSTSNRDYWNLNWINGTGLVLSSNAVNAVPEPSTWGLLLLGVIGVFFASRKKK